MKIPHSISKLGKTYLLLFIFSSFLSQSIQAQSLQIGTINSTCESNGVINVSCTGCSSGVEYEISSGPICSGGICPVSDDPAGTFASLPPGTYTLEALNNGVVEADTIVTIQGSYSEPEPFGRAIFSCPGMSNGAVEIYDVLNGNDPFLFRVFPGDVDDYTTPIGPTETAFPFSNTTYYPNLANGEYSYQVKDSCDVIRTGEVEITEVADVVLDYITNCALGTLCLPNLVIRSQIGTIPLSDPRLASIFPLHIVRVNSNGSIDTVQTLLSPANPDPIPVLNCDGFVSVRVESECGIIYDLGSILIRCVPEVPGFVFRCNANGEIYREYFYGARSGVCPANVVTSFYPKGSLGNPDSLIYQGPIYDFDPVLIQPDTQRYDIITDNTCTNVQDTVICYDPPPYEEEFNWAYLATCGDGESIAFLSPEPLEVISAPAGFPYPLPYTLPLTNIVGYGLIDVPAGQYQIQRQICTDSVLTIEIEDYDFDLQVTDIDIGCDVTTFSYSWTSNFPDSIRMWSQRFIFGTLNAQGVPIRLNVPGAFEQLVFKLEPNGQRTFSLDNEICPDDLGLYVIDVAYQAVTCAIDLSNSCYEAPDGISVVGLPCNNGVQSCPDGSQPYNVVVTAPLSDGVAPFTFEIFEGGTNTLFVPALTTNDTMFLIEQVCQSDLSLDIFVTDFCGQQIMSEIGANILSGSLLTDSTETICTGDTFDLDDAILDYVEGSNWIPINGGPIPNLNNQIIASNAFIGCFIYEYNIDSLEIFGICDNNSISFELCMEGGFRIICPDSMIVSCDDPGLIDSLQLWLGSASVEGICDTSNTNTIVSTTLLSSASNQIYSSIDIYEFEATDNFGNSASCESTFYTLDSVPPVVIVPNDTIIYACPSSYESDLTSWLAQFLVTDNCSEFTMTIELINTIEPCLNEQGFLELTYAFTAEDEFGNSASDSLLTASFTVIDTLLPTIIGPEDLTLSCGGENLAEILNWISGYEVIESCQSFEVTNDWDGMIPNLCQIDTIPINYLVTDACGGTSTTISNIIIEVDTTGPIFNLCPLPAIVVDAPETWCSAFVNYTYPIATASCGNVVISQTDSTGFESGDLFPVGLTVLEFTATDSCGNTSTCSLKIFVNDYHSAPEIYCPEDITISSDFGSCEAVVLNINVDSILDNCLEHVSLTYQIIDSEGQVIEQGLGDASGSSFPLGESQVIYTAKDQPILLISEIIQDELNTGMEIVNLGPSDVNINCATLRVNYMTDSLREFTIPSEMILLAGEVYSYVFPNLIIPGIEASYELSIEDYAIDSITMNSGTLLGDQIIRIDPIDNNDQSDWKLINACESGSFGIYNPQLPAVQSNGNLTSLQSKAPSEASCSFLVKVIDIEAPTCGTLDSVEYSLQNQLFGPGICESYTIDVDGGIITDINVNQLIMNLDSISGLTVRLISPGGISVGLFESNCTSSSDVSISFDDESSNPIGNASCNPFGMGETFQSEESLKILEGEDSQGDWILEVSSQEIQSGEVSFILEFFYAQDYVQNDVQLENDAGLCGAQYEWLHPIVKDNCSPKSMEVVYSFSNAITGHSSTESIILLDSLGSIDQTGSLASRFFEVGTTIISYYLEDASGNESSCSFEVVVIDIEAPSILSNCVDITINLDGGNCYGSIVQQTSFSDNCAVDSFEYYSGGIPIDVSTLSIGIHEISLIVVDIYGNETICLFTVEVLENEQQINQLACNSGINISLDENCEAIINADMILEGDDYSCYDNYCITVKDSNGVIVENLFDLNDVNSTFEVSIEDCNNSGNSCWGYFTIEYKLIPEIQCPDTIAIFCSQDPNAIFPSGHALEGELVTGQLEILSCVNNPVVSYSDNLIDNGNCAEPRAYIERNWTLSYGNNQSVSCTQIIYIEKFDADKLEFPIDLNLDLALECSDVNANPFLTEPSNAGNPTLDGNEIYGAQFCDINMGYWDEILQDVSCPSAYEILRHWTISNECEPIGTSTNPLIHIQRIKVEDNEAPSIGTIQDVTISTDIWECYGSYTLPWFDIEDDCNDVWIEWSASYGLIDGNQITNLLLGETTVTAKVVDACGNFSTTEFSITTVDLIPPVVVAETSHTISLSSNGVAKLYAEDLDDGSHDACGTTSFTVKRMDNGPACNYDEFPPFGNDNAQFNEVVFFCCEDAGDEPILVQFQVCDDAGNCNIAMVNVFVQDKLAPQIICPAALTISCIDMAGIDLSDTELLDELFGSAEAAGSCDVIVSQTAVGSADCGEGVVFRNFTATNAAGSSSCQQIITVTSSTENSLTCDRITFVDLNNSIYDWCEVNDNENNNNDDLPALEVNCDDGLIIPELSIDINGLCTEAGISIDVDSFLFVGGACKKFVVHYEVIDQCIFGENYVDPITGEIDPYQSENGYFEMYLEIDAFDNEAPVLDCNDETVVATSCTGYLGDFSLSGTDNCTDASYFGRQWRLDLNADNSIDYPLSGWASSNEVNPSEAGLTEFPMGTHRIFWIVSDGCGNEATCSQLITITEEEKAPTPYCFDGLSFAVMEESGTVATWANDFDAGSFDNCDGTLILSMIPEQDVIDLDNEEAYAQSFSHSNVTQQANGDWGFTFNCDYIPNGVSVILEVRIYVTDAAGNYDYCTASVRIDDNLDACENDDTGMLTISGDMSTEEGDKIALVDLELKANFTEFPMTYLTDEEGTYSFENLFEMVDYELIPSRNDDHVNGVSTLDIVLIQKHILGLEVIESPYRLIAADVNKDCEITGQDLVQIRKLILGKYISDEFPENTSWRFVQEAFSFQESVQPCEFEELSELPNLNESSIENFYGIKIGDVNGSVQSNLLSEAETRTDKEIDFEVEEKHLIKGQSYHIPVRSSSFHEIYGFQFSLAIDQAELLGIESEFIESISRQTKLKTNEVLFSVSFAEGISIDQSEVIFKLKLKSNTNQNLSDVLSMKSKVQGGLKSEIYYNTALEIANPVLRFNGIEKDEQDSGFVLYQNEPNPFSHSTSIQFDMPKTSEITFRVVDLMGKTLIEEKQIYSEGKQTISLKRSSLNVSGILFYEIEFGDLRISKKMIVLD